MKRIVIPLLLLGLATVAFGGAKRITDENGSKTVTLYNTDSSDVLFLSGMNKVPIVNVNRNEKYDVLTAQYLISAFVAAGGGTPGGMGNIDTAVIKTMAGRGWRSVVLSVDSCASLPCSISVEYQEDIFQAVSTDTATGGTLLPAHSGEMKQLGLLLDDIWFTYRVADSAGTGDTISSEIQWWFRLLEFKDD